MSLHGPSRSTLKSIVARYGPVVLSIYGAIGVSVAFRGYVYPRPLILLAVEPRYGMASDLAYFALAAAAVSAFSGARLRAEQALRKSEGI